MGAHDGSEGVGAALLAELASDEPFAARLQRLRTGAAEPTGGAGAALHLRCAAVAALAGEPRVPELALVQAGAGAAPQGVLDLELTWALVMIEAGRPARACAHVDRARRGLGAGVALLQVLEAQAALGELGFARARALVAEALRALGDPGGAGPAAVYARVVAASLALADEDHAGASSHAAALAGAPARTGLLAGRADLIDARLRFAATRDPHGSGVLLDRAIDRFTSLGAARDLRIAHVVRAMHAVADPAEPAARLVARALPLLAQAGDGYARERLRTAHVAARPAADAATAELRQRRVRLQHVVATRCESGACSGDAAAACAGYQAIDDVLSATAAAEEQLAAALSRALEDRAAMAQLASAAQELAAIEEVGALVTAIPELALLLCPGSTAALLQVGGDGEVEVLARHGAPFALARARLDDVARGAVGRAPGSARAGAPATAAVRRAGPGACVAPALPAEGVAVAVERAAAPGPSDPELDVLAVYASFAGAALARARARAACLDAAARDTATLGAIRDGVLAVDRGGVVRAVNDAASSVLGLRREELLGRRLRDVRGLAALAAVLARAPTPDLEVVTIPHGDVVLRAQAYAGGVVATLRDVATEHVVASRVAGSSARFTFAHLVGAAPAFQRCLEDARRAATSDVPVLICGESGTGKELLAQAIHNASRRSAAPFLGINVTAIPRDLLESELFGYDGGTFTGARAAGRAGKFELAGQGTLLLDEIGDMPLEMQSKLLRVLQERVVQRLGGAKDVPVRARIIATTHRNLAEAVELGRFRLDLFHRLRVLQLHLPPLRERQADVALLVEHQLRAHGEASGRRVRLAPEVLAAFERYDWPGNVRELHNVIEGALSVLAPGQDVLSTVPEVLLEPRRRAGRDPCAPHEILPLDELERRACEAALARFDGNVARAARALGVAKNTLYRKMERYGIGPRTDGAAGDGPTAAPRALDEPRRSAAGD